MFKNPLNKLIKPEVGDGYFETEVSKTIIESVISYLLGDENHNLDNPKDYFISMTGKEYYPIIDIKDFADTGDKSAIDGRNNVVVLLSKLRDGTGVLNTLYKGIYHFNNAKIDKLPNKDIDNYLSKQPVTLIDSIIEEYINVYGINSLIETILHNALDSKYPNFTRIYDENVNNKYHIFTAIHVIWYRINNHSDQSLVPSVKTLLSYIETIYKK